MKIKSVELIEFGGHRHLLVDLDASVAGIIGPNGSGKSTLLTAIKFAWTAVLGGTDEKAESFVRNFGQPGGASNGSVKMVFVKDGAEGTIYRRIGKSPMRWLDWDGQHLTKSAEIDKVLADIIGGDKKAIAEATFIPQGDLDKLLFGLQSEREQLFMKLMMLTFMEKHAQMVDAKIALLSDGLQDLSGSLDEVQLQLDQTNSDLSVLLDQKNVSRDCTPDIQLIESFLAASRDLETSKTQANDYNQEFREKHSRFQSLLAEASPKCGEIGTTYETLKKAFDTRKSLFDYATEKTRKALLALRHFRSIRDNKALIAENEPIMAGYKAELEGLADLADPSDLQARIDRQKDRARLMKEMQEEQTRLNEASKALASFKETPEPVPQDRIDQLEEDLERSSADYTSVLLKLQVRELTTGVHTDSCPICNGTLDPEHMSAEIPALKAEKQRLDIEISRLRKLLRDSKALKQQHINELNRLSGEVSTRSTAMRGKLVEMGKIKIEALEDLQDELQELNDKIGRRKALPALIKNLNLSICQARNQLADFPQEVIDAEGDEKALQAAHDKAVEEENAAWSLFSATEGLLEKATPLHQEIENARRLEITMTTRSQELEDKLTGLKQDIQAAWGEEDLGEVQIRLQQKQEAWQQLLGQISGVRKSIAQIELRKTDVVARMERDAGKRALITDLKRLKDVFTRNGLPMTYVNHRFARLAQLTSTSLSKLEADFAVEVDPSSPVSFQFIRTDEAVPYVMPQSKLSGGQRVKLTVAFLMAVQKLILPNVALLVLDEPTTHLDDEAVIALREMLQEIGTSSEGNESQVIVVDHKPELESAFGKCVSLKRVLTK